MTGTAQIIRGDARHLPLADNTVDLVVTSPPYFALRSYQDGGEHYDGQIGDEATPAEFVDALIEVTRECVRVLKPSGSLWVNLGDRYSGGEPFDSAMTLSGRIGLRRIPPKSLSGLPWRYAIRCIDELGLILRAEVVWSKPNGLPESVTDRVRRSHEQWFHLTLAPRYFSAVDEIREEHQNPGRGTTHAERVAAGVLGDRAVFGARMYDPTTGDTAKAPNPLGKLPGSVWTIPTEPLIVPPELGVDHFAAFPTEWPRRIIQGWCPAGVCIECGEGRRPISEASYDNQGRTTNGPKNEVRRTLTEGPDAVAMVRSGVRAVRETTITGYACACPEPIAPTTPGTVLDPFGGTGTTALVAKALGRTGISVDMSADYCRLAEWRTNDPAQLAKAARKPYTPSVKPGVGQSDLLDLLAEEEPS